MQVQVLQGGVLEISEFMTVPMKKLIAALFVLFLLGVGTVAAGAYYWWNTPAEPSTREINYEVSEGSTLGTVASDLEKLGALRWAPLLRLYARYTGQGNRIKAGDYLFDTHSLPREILAKLVRGEVQTIQFVIPEGYNRFQIAEKLAQTFPQISKETWLAEMNGRKYAAALPAGIQNLEGFLYPETYTIRPKATASEVLFAMVNMFSKHFTEEVTLAGKKLGLEPLQIVTLASIIEKETGRAEERPRISSVFHNRLNKKMRLQTDPTVIYGMWEKYDGNIRK